MANRPLWAQKQSVFAGAVGSKIAHFSGELATTVGLTVVAAVTGKRIRLRAFNVNAMVSVLLNHTVAPSIAFTDSLTYATGQLWQIFSFGVAAAITTPPQTTGLIILPLDGPAHQTTSGNALAITPSVTLGTSGKIQVSGTVDYDEV